MIEPSNANNRRSFLGVLFAASAWFVAVPSQLARAGQQPSSRPPFPDRKADEPDADRKPDTHLILKENQKNIKKDVERLLALAEDLKKEVDKTDALDVLSLPLLKKAEEIEKLAHQIRNLARG